MELRLAMCGRRVLICPVVCWEGVIVCVLLIGSAKVAIWVITYPCNVINGDIVYPAPPLANSRVSARRSPGWGGETVAK